jgi:hypothetical protein
MIPRLSLEYIENTEVGNRTEEKEMERREEDRDEVLGWTETETRNEMWGWNILEEEPEHRAGDIWIQEEWQTE